MSRYPRFLTVLSLLLLSFAPAMAQDLRVHLATLSGEVGARSGVGNSTDAAHYMLTVANAGAAVANDVAVEIQLPMQPTLDPPAVVVFGSFEPPPDFVGCGTLCNPGEVVTWEVGTLAPGESRVVSYLFGMNFFSSGDDFREPVSSSVIASASNAADVSDEATISLDNTPLLRLGLSPNPGGVEAGGTLSYVLTYANAGELSPTGVTLRMPLPDGTSFASATDGGTVSDGTVTWDIGTLVQGEGGQVRLVVDVDEGMPDGALLAARAEIEAGAPAAPPATASATTPIGNSPLRISLGVVSPGGIFDVPELTYILTAGNAGLEPLDAVTATFQVAGLSGGVDNTLNNPLAGITCSFAAPINCEWDVGTLAPGETRIVSGRGYAAAPKLLYGLLTASGSGAVASSVTLLDVEPLLRLTLVPDPGPVAPGERLGYTLTFGNTRDVTPAATTLQMTLPEGTSFVSATSGGTLTDGIVTWTLAALTPGEGGEVRLIVDVDPDVEEGAVLLAQAEANPNNVLESPATATATTPVQAALPLRIAYGVSESTTRPIGIENGELTYSLTVSNAGMEDLGNVRVWFQDPPRISRVYAVPDWTFESPSLWEVGLLAAGESRTAQLLMPIVDASVDTEGEVLYSTAIAEAPGTSSVATAATGVIDFTPTLRIALAPDPGPAAPGERLSYTLTFGNAGEENVSATIRMPVPERTEFVSATGGVTPVDGIVTWNVGTLAPGEGGEVHLTVDIDESAEEGALLHARASADAADVLTTRTSSTAVTPVRAGVPLSVSYDVSETIVGQGDALTYTINVENAKATDLTDVEVRIRLPALLNDVDMPDEISCPFPPPDCGGGSGCSNSRNTCFWNVTVLPSGESETVSYTATAEAPLGDIIRSYATATATGSNDVAFQRNVLVGERIVVSNEPGTAEAFALGVEAYPTPFAGTTTFMLTLPVEDEVRLVIYDVLGRTVGTVVEGRKTAGQHKLSWSAGHLPSGLYLYRLETAQGIRTGSIVQTR